MQCLLTGTEGSGVRAHIIPKSFYTLNYSQKVPLEIITNSEDGYNGKSFTGIYDSGIVTEEGERIFNSWDTYAYTLLVRDRDKLRKQYSSGDLIALEADAYNYQWLKLFFMSLLWRASVTTQRFFRRVDVGPFEPCLREALLASNPGKSDFFSTTLACFINMPTGSVMMDPFREKYEQVNYYRFYLGTYIAYVKVDNRPTPNVFNEFALAPGRSLTIVGRDFHVSKEKVLIQRLIEENGS